MMARTRSQAARCSNRKFKKLERRVASLLDGWLGAKLFRRTIQSGAFNKSGKVKIDEGNMASDIMCKDGMKFAIEVKSGKGFSLDAMLNNDSFSKTKFTEWWLQVNHDADSVDKLPWLWFKPRPAWDWIAIDQRGIEILDVPVCLNRFIANMYGQHLISGIIREGSGKKEIERYLPEPVIFRWKNFMDAVNGNFILLDQQVLNED